MKKFKELAKKIVIKYGNIITTCAFAFAILTTNSSSVFVFFEPEEPNEIKSLKKN